ncbi:hypothetical protein MHYP_G00131400 [Metynnis hypsauchen]
MVLKQKSRFTRAQNVTLLELQLNAGPQPRIKQPMNTGGDVLLNLRGRERADEKIAEWNGAAGDGIRIGKGEKVVLVLNSSPAGLYGGPVTAPPVRNITLSI